MIWRGCSWQVDVLGPFGAWQGENIEKREQIESVWDAIARHQSGQTIGARSESDYSKTKVTYSIFHVSDYNNNKKVIAEYLTSAAQDENPDVLLKALDDVAKARGMAQVAKDSELGRERQYKALIPRAKPRCETVVAIL
jgi:probable addiction module antidote protein